MPRTLGFAAHPVAPRLPMVDFAEESMAGRRNGGKAGNGKVSPTLRVLREIRDELREHRPILAVLRQKSRMILLDARALGQDARALVENARALREGAGVGPQK